MPIPRILHQTWKSSDIPPPLARFSARFRELNPDFEYRLWTDAQNDAFVRDEFPRYYRLYRSFSRGIYRADVARILYLLRFGGVYVDLDIEPLRALDGFLETSGECVLGAEPEAHARKRCDKQRLSCNAIMASAPGHPFWLRLLEEIERRAAQPGGDPVAVTGPLALDAVYETHGVGLGVRVSEPDAFFPLPDLDAQSLPLDPRKRRHFERMRELRLYPQATFGVHHWAHTWIPEAGLNRGLLRMAALGRRVGGALRGETTIDEILRPERYKLHFPESAFAPRQQHARDFAARVTHGSAFARGSSLTIVTLLHNRVDLALYLRARCEALLGRFAAGSVLIACDDSTDGTAEVIADWARARPGEVVSVPVPSFEPELGGFGRMARLRNALLDELERRPPSDFIAVLDGDLEGPVSADGVAHSIALLSEAAGPQAVAALGVNNWGGLPLQVPFVGYSYYDPIAFREATFERSARDAAVRYRLRHLRRGDAALPVKSAFAGLALYHAASIRGLRYDELSRDCEHVGFHRALAERGGRLVVNPALMLLAGRQGHHRAARA